MDREDYGTAPGQPWPEAWYVCPGCGTEAVWSRLHGLQVFHKPHLTEADAALDMLEDDDAD